jgi:hypothetical protein
MKVAIIVLLLLGGFVAALLLNAAPETPADPHAPPTGPATVLGGIKQRAKEKRLKAQKQLVTEIEGALRTDAGAAATNP